MLSYYIPLIYTFKTRYKNVISIISFFIFTCLPSVYFVVLYNSLSFLLLLGYIVSFLSMYAIYECGYLFNDVLTVHYENNPTLRIDEKYLKIFPKHLENLLTLRFTLAAIGCVWLYYNFANIHIYALCIFLLLIVYSFHNYARGYINIFTMCLLVSLKNIIPVLPFVELNRLLGIYIIVFFTIVFLRTWEYASKKFFNIEILKIVNVDILRVKYYLFLVFTSLMLIYVKHISIIYLGLPLIFCFYRLVGLLFIKNISFFNKIENNRK